MSWVSPSLGWPAKPLSVAGNGLLAASAMYTGVANVRLTASVKELVLESTGTGPPLVLTVVARATTVIPSWPC